MNTYYRPEKFSYLYISHLLQVATFYDFGYPKHLNLKEAWQPVTVLTQLYTGKDEISYTDVKAVYNAVRPYFYRAERAREFEDDDIDYIENFLSENHQLS